MCGSRVAPSQWQPIATVPPDTVVLVYERYKDQNLTQSLTQNLILVTSWQTEPYPHWRGYPWIDPTHWQPLPLPPP